MECLLVFAEDPAGPSTYYGHLLQSLLSKSVYGFLFFEYSRFRLLLLFNSMQSDDEIYQFHLLDLEVY